MIYFDNASTTKPNKEFLTLYSKINQEYWFNESSPHQLGIMSQTLLKRASDLVLKSLNISQKRVVFTTSATEANNLAIYGICNKYIFQNKHIITSKIEHPSVLNCFKHLEKLGFKVTYLDVDRNGVIDLEMFKRALTKDTILVSIMWVNNIVGSIQPIKEIIEILKAYPRVKFHSDLVQGIGKVKPDFSFNDLDMMTLTAHKMNGLKGSACLILNQNLNLDSLLKGGHQQYNLRGGTVDVALAICFAKALAYACEHLENHYQKVNELYIYLIAKLEALSSIIINSPPKNYSPYVINISLEKIKGETLMHYLEQSEIYVGYGSACNANTQDLEPTLMEMYHDEIRAINAIRISLSAENTQEEIDILVEKLKEIGNR